LGTPLGRTTPHDTLEPLPLSEAQARRHVHGLVRRAGSSFFWAMRMLPSERREAVYAIYAFCREVDDIADEDGDAEDKVARLRAWRQEIAGLYAGRAATPTGVALLRDITRFDLPREEFLRLIDAVEVDANTIVHAPRLDELGHYCRGVAGAVGMLLIRIFGARGVDAEAFAVALAEALQLTNILRDLAEDAARGRLYLPREALAQAGIEPAAPLNAILADPRLPAVCDLVAERAEARFAEAERRLEHCDRRALKSALVMGDVYHELLRRLRRRGWRELDRRVRVGRFYQLRVALRYMLF